MRQNSSWLDGVVRAMFGLQGGEVVPEVSEVVQAVAVVDNDRPEWLFAGYQRRTTVVQTQAAVGGQFSWVAITNPPGSGTLVIVEEIVTIGDTNIFTIIPAQISANGQTIGAGRLGGQTMFCRDQRLSLQVPTAWMDFGAVAAIPFVGPVSITLARIPHGREYILPPGTGVAVAMTVIAAAITAQYSVRERILEKTLKG